MNWDTVLLLFKHELRVLLRDRRTVVVSLILPLVIMPLMVYAGRFTRERRDRTLKETNYTYGVTGTWAIEARDLINNARQSLAEDPPENKNERDRLLSFKFQETRTPDPAASLSSRQIHFYLEALTGTEADALAKKEKEEREKKETGATSSGRRSSSSRRPTPERTRLDGVPLIKIHFLGNRDSSQAGSSRMRELLMRTRRAGGEQELRARGFPVEPKLVFEVEETSVASPAQVTGAAIGRFLTVFLLIFLLTGGSVASMDIIAGEKEKGTLETLLTTAVQRTEIVAAKQLAILSVALAITLIQVANILAYLTFKIIKLPEDFVIQVPPVTILALLLLFVPVAAVVAAVLLMISGYAKSFKEAQLYFLPVYLLSLVPALAAVLPGLELRSAIAVVPLANVSVAVREVMVGKYDWPMIAITFGVMTLTATWVVRASARMLSNERLITASQADEADLAGGPVLFPKHVLRWYAVMAAVFFTVAANIPQLATFRRQLLFNESILLGGALLMIWIYRLNLREALALRSVKPAVWVATLMLIPSGHIVAIGVFRLANLVVPVPTRALEQFGRQFMPPDIPAWQLYLLIAIVPGICEEIAFRGTLLYGLRKKFRPLVLAVVVGLIFGLFHVELFRIAPTGFLGVILTAVTLLTGSIFPSMVAHAGNNAFALWAGKAGLPLAALDWWFYAGAAVIFLQCLEVLYRHRTPYPDLKK